MHPKTKVLGTRATPEMYAEAKKVAEAKGKTVSEWLHGMVKNSLRQTRASAHEAQQ